MERKNEPVDTENTFRGTLESLTKDFINLSSISGNPETDHPLTQIPKTQKSYTQPAESRSNTQSFSMTDAIRDEIRTAMQEAGISKKELLDITLSEKFKHLAAETQKDASLKNKILSAKSTAMEKRDRAKKNPKSANEFNEAQKVVDDLEEQSKDTTKIKEIRQAFKNINEPFIRSVAIKSAYVLKCDEQCRANGWYTLKEKNPLMSETERKACSDDLYELIPALCIYSMVKLEQSETMSKEEKIGKKSAKNACIQYGTKKGLLSNKLKSVPSYCKFTIPELQSLCYDVYKQLLKENIKNQDERAQNSSGKFRMMKGVISWV